VVEILFDYNYVFFARSAKSDRAGLPEVRHYRLPIAYATSDRARFTCDQVVEPIGARIRRK
jgi:hypothetical protein